MIYLDMWMDSPLLIGGTIGLLIVLDIILTRMGYRLKQEGYVKYFVTDIYEMNPVHQDTIHKEQPFRVKQVVLWVALVVAITVLSFYSSEGELEILYGAIVLLYVRILMKHIQNIFLFRHINNHPEQLRGQLKIEIPYIYSQARVQAVIFGFLWLSFFFLFDRVFFLGGALTSGFQILLYFVWERASLKNSS